MDYSWQDEFGTRFIGKKVLVTGATGFIGGHLCEALQVLGARLYALGLESEPPNYINAERYIRVDLTDPLIIPAIISEFRPDLVFHLAGLVTASRDYNLILPMLQNNLLSTVNLLLAITGSSCARVVITGTAEEPEMQSTDGVPTSPYSASKMAGTLYARMFHRIYKLPVVIARPFIVYGPRQHSSKLIPHTILSVYNREQPQLRNPERVCDFIFVLDLVRGLLEIATQDGLVGDVIELGTGIPMKIKEAFRIIVEIMGSEVTLNTNYPVVESREPSLIANIQKTATQVRWQPLWSFKEGVKETILWYSK